MTTTTQLVLRALVDAADREVYGLEICRLAELPTGTVHPILARLEKLGWVTSRWENIDTHEEGRPRRRYYQLSREGLQDAHNALARVHLPTPLRVRLRPGLAGET
jgi:PadR family transcriptional regulator, regulatory protein PadR